MDRRQFLTAGSRALGAAAVLGACGSSSRTAAPATTRPATTSGFVVARRFPNTVLTPGTVRLPISLADATGTIVQRGPEVLTGSVIDAKGAKVATFSTPAHSTDLVFPYWPITVQLPQAGLYGLVVDGATGDPAAFQLFDPTDVPIPTTGSKLPAFDTPTTSDARGVSPVCTLTPTPCPFHSMTLRDALPAGKPVVYMVGTPAHCQTGTCGPSLQFLVAAATPYAGKATFVHAEVYTDDTATVQAPAVEALKLDYEPVLFITDASGTLVDRLDVVWDAAEITAVLAARLGPIS
jgi:hypothetical protein